MSQNAARSRSVEKWLFLVPLLIIAWPLGRQKWQEAAARRHLAQLKAQRLPVRVIKFPGQFEGFALSPDGATVATNSKAPAAFSATTLWDVETGKQRHAFPAPVVRTPKGFGGWLMCGVAFSPDGKQLFRGRVGFPVEVYDSSSGALRRRLPFSQFNFSLSPDGKWLGLKGEWRDSSGGNKRSTFNEPGPVESDFSVDGSLYVVCRPIENGPSARPNRWEVLVRSLPSGRVLHRWKLPHKGAVVDISLWPDKRMLVCAQYIQQYEYGVWMIEGSRLCAFDVATGKKLWNVTLKRSRPTENVIHWYGVRCSPQGNLVVTQEAQGGRIWLWRLRDGACLGTLNQEGDPRENSKFYVPLAFSRDGKILASGRRDQIRIWDVDGLDQAPEVPIAEILSAQ